MNEQRGEGRQNRRRTRLISPSFQWRYAAIVAVSVALASTVPSVILFGILHDEARAMLVDPGQSTSRVAVSLVCFCGGVSLLMGGVTALASLVFTHRVCGPIFVLQNYMKELAAGRLPHVRPLRERDEFKDLMTAFGNAVTAMGARQTTAGRCLDEILEQAENMAACPSDAKALLADLRAKVAETRDQFARQGQPTTSCSNEATAAVPSLNRAKAYGA